MILQDWILQEDNIVLITYLYIIQAYFHLGIDVNEIQQYLWLLFSLLKKEDTNSVDPKGKPKDRRQRRTNILNL